MGEAQENECVSLFFTENCFVGQIYPVYIF